MLTPLHAPLRRNVAPWRQPALAVALLLAASVGPASRADAQQLAIALSTGEGSRRSDMGTMRGGYVGYMPTRGTGRTSWHIGVDVLTRGGESVGTPCSGGPLPPGTCLPETLDERRRITTGALGFGFDVVREGGARLQLHADALAGQAFTRDRGRTSGQSREASRVVVGGRVGASLAWQPLRSRFGVFASADTEGLKPLGVDDCVDCFIPFGGGFGLTRFSMGVSFGTLRAPLQ